MQPGEPPLVLGDVAALASARLPPFWAEYVAGGAGDERTLRANVEAFRAWRPRQRVLTGLGSVDTSVTLLGQDVGSPVVVAPVAYQGLMHEDGELGMARAAAATGSVFCLSTFATVSPAEVASAAPGCVTWLQLYVFRDRGVTSELVAQALEAGCRAIVLTVDLPVLAARDRERRLAWAFPDESLPAVRFARGRGVAEPGVDIVDPGLDWTYLEQLCASLPVPVLVKGVLEVEDAIRAADAGAAGVVVSNHGGRQLDGVMPTLDALPPIVDAVGDRVEVLLDGGIRRGVDVAVAVALGARAVLAGRMPVWGLAARGEEGARTVLELLREETRVALQLMGCASARELDRSHVARATVD